MTKLEVAEFLKSDAPCLDIRSPAEYQKAHLPGASSLPLFTDEERAQVGTTYKQEGQKAAIKLGLELVGPKMRRFIEQAEVFDTPIFKMYCWRGGMRSSSMGWLLEQYGFEVLLLKGGYKSYRQDLLTVLDQPVKLRVLTGLTGSGKTDVLKRMEALGAQVVDLEGLANHPGSSFGNALQLVQPSTEMFQNKVLAKLQTFDLSRPVWVEDESICIGQVHLPEKLYAIMQESKKYILEVSAKERVQLLVEQYGGIGKEKLMQATHDISKKLGSDKTQVVLEALENEDLEKAAEALITYYDRQYKKGIKEAEIIHGERQPAEEVAQFIINKYGS